MDQMSVDPTHDAKYNMEKHNYSSGFSHRSPTQQPNISQTTVMLHYILWENKVLIAASSAAICGVLGGFPFDSIKTRMQTHNYRSAFDCVKKTYAEEGLHGFFRGMLPPLATISVIKSISFSVYEGTKSALCTRAGLAFQDFSIPSSTAVAFVSGAASGSVISLLSCPLELVKIQKQLEQLLWTREHAKAPDERQTRIHTTSWHSAKEIVRLKGVRGLWYGFPSHFARDALGTGMYFGSYETWKRVISGPGNPSGPLTHFFAGGLCGIFSWLIIFPIDLVKSMYQKEALSPRAAYKNTWQCAQAILKESGLAGFYRGINVTLVRAFPIHSLNFLVYEHVLKMIRVYTNNGEWTR
ncbi:uncharacterized protein VTP21DRAFT_11509 [Calcarisporiella thermophila]|uniref:uncharacterized protein n=1 Tax=Calcarisporiella thermophila TaxID=911321 RepID=UPI003743AFC6